MALFSINSGFFKFVQQLLDVLWLNVLWLVFSIPIITIGASTTAVFYVTQKMVDNEEGYVGRMFVKAFRANFKQGTILWLITAAASYALYIEWQMVIKWDDISFLIIIIAILSTAFVIASLLYTFPLIARYENTIKNTILNSFAITVRFFPRTIFIVFLVALEVAIILFNWWTIFVGILIGPVIIIYTVSGISKRIFQRIDREGVAGNGVNAEKENEILKRINSREEEKKKGE